MLPLLFLLAGVLSPEQSRQLAERYNQARALMAGRNYEQAGAALGALVRDFGSSEFGDELRYTLAETRFSLGQYGRAADLFGQLVDRSRQPYIKPEALYGLAISAIMMGDLRRAQQALNKLSQQPGYDRSDRTNLAAGVLHYFQKDYAQAIARLSGVELPEAKYFLGKAYAVTGRPLPALLKFKEVTDSSPGTPLAALAHFAAGQALFTNRDYDGAQAKFRFFVENFPGAPLTDYADYFLGCVLLARKQYAQAIERLTPLTRHSNNLLAAHANYFVGYANMALGQAQAAVERFQRVRSNYPRSKVAGYANLQLSGAMLATTDTAQALLASSQLATLFSTGHLTGTGNYLSGVISYQRGHYDRARRQFETILTSHTATALREPACAMLLLLLNSSGQYEQCAALGAKHVSDFPGDTTEWRARVLYFLAEALYSDHKFSQADAYYQQAYTQASNSDLTAYARLGRCYSLYHLGRLNEAAKGFQALFNARLADTLFTISAYLGYGYALFNQKEFLAALDVFEPLYKTFPEREQAAEPAYFYAGYCYYQLGYYGQAVDAWTALINRFPASNRKAPEAAFRSGDTYFKALEYDKALSVFRFVIERYPFSEFGPPSQALIAQCYYNRKQYLDAVREYQKFLDLYPSDPQVSSIRKSLETSYYLAGQQDSAAMDDFLRRYPQSEMAAAGQYDKGKLLFDAGRYDQAIAELQKAVVNLPGSPVAAEAQLLTGEAYAQMKSWPEAARAYQKFLDYYPQHDQRAGAVFNLATAYFNLGDYKLSLESFQRVLDSFPQSEYGESAKQNLEVCRKRLGAARLEDAGSEAAESDSGPAKPAAPTTQGEKQP